MGIHDSGLDPMKVEFSISGNDAEPYFFAKRIRFCI